MNERSAVSSTIKWIGIIQMVLGFIGVFYFYQGFFIMVAGLFASFATGMLIIGFAEVIHLLTKLNRSVNQDGNIVVEQRSMPAPTASATASATPAAVSAKAPAASNAAPSISSYAQEVQSGNSIRIKGNAKGEHRKLSVFNETPVTLQISNTAFMVDTVAETIIHLPVTNIKDCSTSGGSEVLIVYKDEHGNDKKLTLALNMNAKEAKEEIKNLIRIINAFVVK